MLDNLSIVISNVHLRCDGATRTALQTSSRQFRRAPKPFWSCVRVPQTRTISLKNQSRECIVCAHVTQNVFILHAGAATTDLVHVMEFSLTPQPPSAILSSPLSTTHGMPARSPPPLGGRLTDFVGFSW